MLFGKRNTLGNLFSDVQCDPEKHNKNKRKSLFRAFSLISRRSIDSHSSSLSSPRTPSPRATFSDFANSCELIIITALQCHSVTPDEMRICSQEIQTLPDGDKLKLIQFIKTDAPGVIENNALKSFQCSQLSTQVLIENLEIFEELWSRIVDVVIPTLQAMVFPLNEVEKEFDVQKIIFTAFRDRVMAKVLQDVTSEIPQIKSILTVIMIETDENINPETRSKFDICLGKTQKKFLKKTRSKTDSCLTSPSKSKSVTWKSSTFSS